MSPPIRRHAANFARLPVPWRFPRSDGWKPENRALVVVVTTLQLLLIVVVWLLAIVPAALLALAAMAFKAIRGERGGPGPQA